MVVGGAVNGAGGSGFPTDHVEVATLDFDSHPVTDCMRQVAPFPYMTGWAMGRSMPNGQSKILSQLQSAFLCLLIRFLAVGFRRV